MPHAVRVWANSDFDLGCPLFNSVRQRFEISGTPSKYYLCARLKVAAIITQR